MRTNRTPKQTVQAYCAECVQSTRRAEIEKCGGYLVYATGKPCHFFPYRLGGKRVPMSAFRHFCLSCQGGSVALVRECEANCLLQTFRFGKNPHIKGASRERMAAIRTQEGGIVTGFLKNEALSLPGSRTTKIEP
jgi:hypothetical protein